MGKNLDFQRVEMTGNKEKFINFINNRSLKQVNNTYARFAPWILAIIGPIISWQCSTIYERIILLAGLWLYFCITLFYASDKRMKDVYKKNRYYGWSLYIISLLYSYVIYRFKFELFNWQLFTILLIDNVIQPILWVLGVKRNIIVGNYENKRSIERMGFNFYVIIQAILRITAMVLISAVYIINGFNDFMVLIFVNLLFVLHWGLLSGLTFLYQNHIIKKYYLFYIL